MQSLPNQKHVAFNFHQLKTVPNLTRKKLHFHSKKDPGYTTLALYLTCVKFPMTWK